MAHVLQLSTDKSSAARVSKEPRRRKGREKERSRRSRSKSEFNFRFVWKLIILMQ